MNRLKKIILASGSPRRRELLAMCGFEFEVRTKNTDESHPPGIEAERIPEHLAERKALAFSGELNDEILIAADTVVILNDKIYEKPTDANDAEAMLLALSGKTHTVVTGVCIICGEQKFLFSERTKVTFCELSRDEISYYVKKFQPFDKAGAYACQEWIGAIGIASFEGSYHNVVGLPTHRVYQVIKQLL